MSMTEVSTPLAVEACEEDEQVGESRGGAVGTNIWRFGKIASIGGALFVGTVIGAIAFEWSSAAKSPLPRHVSQLEESNIAEVPLASNMIDVLVVGALLQSHVSDADYYLHVSSGSMNSGDPVCHTDSTTEGSEWQFEAVGSSSDIFMLKNVRSGFYLHVSSQSMKDGDQVFHTDSTTEGSQWQVKSLSSDSGMMIMLKSVRSGFYLHASERSARTCCDPVFHTSTVSDASRWRVIPLGFHLSDPSSMIPLSACKYRKNDFCVSVIGSAISGEPYEINYDTGSWTTSIPDGCIDINKVDVLDDDIVVWNTPCKKVKGQIGMKSKSGSISYLADDYVFFIQKNTPCDRTKDYVSGIMGAAPQSFSAISDLRHENISLPFRLAYDKALKGQAYVAEGFSKSEVDGNYVASTELFSGTPVYKQSLLHCCDVSLHWCNAKNGEGTSSEPADRWHAVKGSDVLAWGTKCEQSNPGACDWTMDGEAPNAVLKLDGYGLGIVTSKAEGNINDNYNDAEFNLHLGYDEAVTAGVTWQTNFPSMVEWGGAIEGFDIVIGYPTQGWAVTVTGLMATIDTGSPEMKLRVSSEDPQINGPLAAHTVECTLNWMHTDTPDWHEYLADSRCLADGVAVVVTFTGTIGKPISYVFQATNNVDSGRPNPPTDVILGKWDGVVPWKMGSQYPKNRIDLGNSLYFFTSVYFWDFTKQAIGMKQREI